MWLVFLKELKELTRDRKTLFFMVALPILIFPMLIGITIYFSTKAIEDAQSEVLKYSVVGEQFAPELISKINDSGQFELVAMPDDTNIVEWIKAGNVEFVLEVPANFSNDLLAAGPIALNLHLNDAGLNLVEPRLTEIVNPMIEQSRTGAFEKLGITEEQGQAILNPIVITKNNIADKREDIGEKIGGMIPYFIFILCLQGAMIPATDMGAGEKERGTLETLLISPTERYKLVLGKFFTIAFAGITSAFITIVSMATWGIVLSQGMAVELVAEFMGAISGIDFVLMFLMLVPVVAIFASILLSLSIYARSFKEAQGYMTPVVFAVIIPVIMSALPGVELKGVWAWVPLTNVALAIKELIKGTMDYFALFAIFGSTAIIAGGLLAFCVHWFTKEKVLFR